MFLHRVGPIVRHPLTRPPLPNIAEQSRGCGECAAQEPSTPHLGR